MRIDKAIEIETIHNDHNLNYTDAERQQAHQLGIEALKNERDMRIDYPERNHPLLPGETEE